MSRLGLATKRTSSSSSSTSESSAPKRICRNQEQISINESRITHSNSKFEDRCGKIIKMHLTNFMCHTNLSMDFHKRVNFLIGSNGSGKSAIIAALVIGLGSNARATSRSPSLKQFIKIGENSAKIEITLCNSGPCAYKPELFGAAITITRVLTASGGSTYTIKNENGRVVGKKADELKVITLFHNLQVDNPAFVLNQEHSREFLKDFDPKKNYTMFMKATQLEIIAETLNTCMLVLKTNADQMKLLKKNLYDVLKNITKLKEKLEMKKSHSALKLKLKTKKCERLWIAVAILENTVTNKLAALEKQKEVCEKLKNVIYRKDELEMELTVEMRNFNVEIDNKKRKFRDEENSLNTLRESFKKFCNLIQESKSQCEIIQSRISNTDRDIEEIRNKLEESKNSASDVKEQRRRHDEDEKTFTDEIKKNVELLENIKEDQQETLGQRMQLQEKLMEIRNIVISETNKKKSFSNKIQNLRGAVKNRLSYFNENAVRLQNIIKKHAQKFSQLPKGPVGYCIDVPNTKYRDIIEHIIGRQLLESYIVNNGNDRRILQNLIKTNFASNEYSPNVIQVKFRSNVYNTSKGQTIPPRGTALLMNEIKCTDVDIMNCLIDHRQPEQILLTESLDIATNLCSQRENVPHNMIKMFVTQIKMEIYPSPKYRMYSINVRPAKLIAVDQQSQISQLETEAKEVDLRIISLEKENVKLKGQLSAINELLTEKGKKKIKIENIVQDLKRKLLELDYTIIPDNNHIDMLTRALKDVKQQKANFQSRIEDLEKSRKEYEVKRNELQKETQTQKKVLDDLYNEMELVTSKVQEKKTKLDSLDLNFSQNKTRLEKAEKVILELKKINENLTKNLEIAKKDAEAAGERIDSKLSLEDIDKELEEIENQLMAHSCCNESVEQLQENINESELSTKKMKKKIQMMRECFTTLKESLVRRFDFITKFRTHMVITLQHAFIRLLGLRSFKGMIEVDHTEKMMTISVIPRTDQIELTVSSTKSLSGGERSFSTVAFLLSLWSCVDHPFYFLDEYDVFTDDVNRQFMTRLLLSEGESRINRQYCFSTPLDTHIPFEKFIKIHKLSEPQRN